MDTHGGGAYQTQATRVRVVLRVLRGYGRMRCRPSAISLLHDSRLRFSVSAWQIAASLDNRVYSDRYWLASQVVNKL